MEKTNTLFDELRNTENDKNLLQESDKKINFVLKEILKNKNFDLSIDVFCSKYLSADINEIKKHLNKSKVYKLNFLKIFCLIFLEDLKKYQKEIKCILFTNTNPEDLVFEGKFNILNKWLYLKEGENISSKDKKYQFKDLDSLVIKFEHKYLNILNRIAEINLYDWVNISESGDKALNFDNWAFIPKDEKLLIDQCDKKGETMLYKTIADFYKAETIKQKEEKLLSLIKDLEPEWNVNLNNEHDKYLMFDASNKGWWQQKKWSCNLIRHNNENLHHKRFDKLSEEEIKLTNWYKNSSDEEKTKFLIDILRFLLILKMYKTNSELDLKEIFKIKNQ